MGFFGFLKDAGEVLLGKKAQAGERIGSVTEILAYISKMNLQTENLNVEFDPASATARVTGTVPNNEIREKIILSVGNVAGVAKVDDQLVVKTQAPETTDASQFYQVKSGDTLSKIAKQFYGDANLYPQIFEANKPMLIHPDKIYPGQTLRIPPGK